MECTSHELISESLNANREVLEKKLDEILDELKALNAAFPKTEDGHIDSEGHRRYHEHLIEAAHAQTLFWNQMQLDVAKKGIWGLLTILIGLALIGAASFIGLDELVLDRIFGR